MPYDSLIDRTDVGALIPEDVSRTIIQGLPAASVALTSFRRATMTRAQQRLPVLSVLPVAYWVDGDTGSKQTTEQHWANKYLDARELAVIVPIPQAVLDDVDFDIWGEVRPRLVEAFGVKIDAAAIFGTDKPAGWPDSIVEAAVAAGNVVEVGESAGDIAADVNLVMGKVEEDGFDVSGFWARRAMKAAFRGLRDDNGQPIFQPSLTAGTPGTLYGESILYPTNGAWDATQADLIAGDVSRRPSSRSARTSATRSSPRPSSATPRARSSSTSRSRTRWPCARSCGSPSRSPTPSASRPRPRPRASPSRSWPRQRRDDR